MLAPPVHHGGHAHGNSHADDHGGHDHAGHAASHNGGEQHAATQPAAVTHVEPPVAEHHEPAAFDPREVAAGRYYLCAAERRIRQSLADLWSNDDEATTKFADCMLAPAPRPADGSASGDSHGH